MVPGMTERERLAADLRRAEWLADAALGPIQIHESPSRRWTTPQLRPRNVLSAIRLFSRGIRRFMTRPEKVAAGRAPAQSH